MHRIILFFLPLLYLSANAQMKPETGSLKHYEKFPSKFVEPRSVDVWLPDGYSTKQRYSVLYMHDGQMLLTARQPGTNRNGKPMKLPETSLQLRKPRNL